MVTSFLQHYIGIFQMLSMCYFLFSCGFSIFFSVLSSQGGCTFKPHLVLPVKKSNAKRVVGVILSERLLKKKVTVFVHPQRVWTYLLTWHLVPMLTRFHYNQTQHRKNLRQVWRSVYIVSVFPLCLHQIICCFSPGPVVAPCFCVSVLPCLPVCCYFLVMSFSLVFVFLALFGFFSFVFNQLSLMLAFCWIKSLC